jgi:CDP-paratose 2-epimerase
VKILVSGSCGFVGRCIIEQLLAHDSQLTIYGIDNFSRAGSQLNVEPLKAIGVRVIHGDVRAASDLESLPPVDWIIDAAANPSVLAGVDGKTSSRQLLENNLYGTINLLELAKRFGATFTLISTSRVYSAKALAALPTRSRGNATEIDTSAKLPKGVSAAGVTEEFSTKPPLSLYGVSKLASELIALEYADAFNIPVWINRCGVLAGAGQFGRGDQGIFAYWINAWLRRAKLRYIGFDGTGTQTRDCFHPADLVPLVLAQFKCSATDKPRIVNLGGGAKNTMSLAQLSDWCAARFGAHEVESDPQPRRFDVPWLVMDYALAQKTWDWSPARDLHSILEEIADHAERNPDWLKISGAL